MRAMVGYESMYGNTRLVAEAIGRGLAAELGVTEVTVCPVGKIDAAGLAGVDLLALGGPTHGWGMSRPGTRVAAAQRAAKADSGLAMEPDTANGIREWIAALPAALAPPHRVAVFDTRMRAPLGLSGAASRAIAKRLRRHGIRTAVRPKGFFVTKQNALEPAEVARAEAWGKELAGLLTAGYGSTGR